MLDKVNLSDVRSFVLVAELESFTRCADALGVSRSHVSRQITRLERDLGVTLLVRTTRSLKLTPEGRGLYQRCHGALGNINQALMISIEDTQQLRGHLAINCVGGVLGEDILVPIVNQFMKQHPQVSINLDFSSNRVDLISDEFDIAFRMGELEDAGFIARKLFDVEMLTLASPEYLQQYSQPTHPRQLDAHRCLIGSVNRWSFVENHTGERIETVVNGYLQCKNGRALINGALQGNGIVRVPKLYCEQAITKGRLINVFQDWHIPSVSFSMIYHKDRFRPARLTSLIEFIYREFESRSLSK
ncbi:LysR family transcriptional regulator [Vibrio gallicus]|uniref:LysR family transcriptional regulator n=1 Tax=Vibrio gallicus TaxID=190897 RepID=UPI0021C260CB|nr:LysR family transcriptional regulator [Vibrio gallicus]